MKQKQLSPFFYFILFFSILIPSFCCQSLAYASEATEDTWFLDDIKAQDAWSALTEALSDFSSPVIVAVIDTGCDYSNPLIKNALWTNPAESGGIPGIDDDCNGYVDDIYGIDTYNQDSDPMDDSVSTIKGHGTHVAGCILQTAGVTETANPFGIQIMPIKSGDAYGNFDAADVAEALRYAADNGASVINLSISSPKSPSILQEALEYASQSAILVASSGNKGLPTSDSLYTSCGDYYPAAYPYVAGIMSYDKKHQLSVFSNWDFCENYGPEYEIAAPGDTILSCTYNGSQKTMSGTSMSAGIVSGCAALLTAKYAPLGIYSPGDLTAHLMASGSNDITFTDIYGKSHFFRRIDLHRLLSNPPKPNLTLTDYAISKNDSAPGSYELNYMISNKGCRAKNINVSFSVDSPEVDLHMGLKPSETLSALSGSNGSCSFSLPDDSTMTSIQLAIQISYENGTGLPGTETFSCQKKLSITTENSPSCTEKEIPLQGITISASPQAVMKAGSSLQLTVSYIPENTTDDRSLTFQSSQPLIADIDENGMIFAKKTGTAKISVTVSNKFTRQITVLVYDDTDITPATPDKPDTTLTVPDTPKQENEKPSAAIRKGKVYTVEGMKYKVTNASTNGSKTVSLIGTAKKKSSLHSLTVKDTVQIKNTKFRVTALGKAAFSNCKNLKSVKIPNSVKTIGTACFSKCTALKKLTIGNGVVKISPRAFDGCGNLKKITVKSKKAISIGKNAFRGIHSKAKYHAPRSFLTQLSKYQ